MTDETPDISPEDKRKLFKERFAAVMMDMGQNVHKDPESLYLIGSLAAHLVDKANLTTWTELKAALSQHAYSGLINSFKDQGNEHHKKGNQKVAYAIEILAISVICKTQNDDPQVGSGEQLLDKMIEDTIGFYRRRSANRNNAPKPN